MPSKLFTVKAAAAALVAVLSIGGVAAAAALLPGQVRPVADQAASTTAAGAAAHGLGKAAVADLDRATHGLCQAWQAGEGTDQGARMDSVAFQALAAAAGGADNIAAYCEDVTADADSHGQGLGQAASPPSVSAPPTTVSPPSSGPPTDPGPPASTGPGGHGQGGPPTTTG
jgi:hypothetical protein